MVLLLDQFHLESYTASRNVLGVLSPSDLTRASLMASMDKSQQKLVGVPFRKLGRALYQSFSYITRRRKSNQPVQSANPTFNLLLSPYVRMISILLATGLAEIAHIDLLLVSGSKEVKTCLRFGSYFLALVFQN